MRFLFACAAFSLLLAGPESRAGNNYWSRIGPFGGDISALKFDPADASCALAISNNEVIHSCSNGNAWEVAYFQGWRVAYPSQIAVGPSRYYAYVLQSTLMTSTDRGRTWTGMPVPFKIRKLQVDAVDTRNVYALVDRPAPEPFGSYDLVRSSDAGTTWSIVALPAADMSAYDVVTDPLRSNLLYLGLRSAAMPAANAYYKSTDSGATWIALTNTGLPDGGPAYLAMDPAAPDTLYMTRRVDGPMTMYLSRSTDGGKTWQAAPTNLPPGNNLSDVVVPDPAQPGTLYIAGAEIFKSTDGGRIWSLITPSIAPDAAPISVVVHPTGLFAATQGGLFRSSDNGVTWQEITAGFSGRYIEAFEIDDPRIIVRTTHPVATSEGRGFYQTTDNAAWTRIDPPPAPINSSFGAGAVRSVGAFPWSRERYAAASRAAGTEAPATLYRSTDDGATWTVRTIIGIDVPDVLLAATSDAPPLLIGGYFLNECAVTSPGVVTCSLKQVPTISTDGGETWRQISKLPASRLAVAISPLQPRTIVLAQDGGIARSIDGGNTFQQVSGTETLRGVLFADPHHSQTFYLSGVPFGSQPTRFYRSIDSGLTWNFVALDPVLSEQTGAIVDLHFSETRPDRVDAITSTGMLVRSEDAGATWKTLSMGPNPDNSAFVVQFGRHDPTTAYMVTFDHGILAYTIAREAPVDVVEFYNTVLDHYFITAAAEEADGIDRGAAGPGWSRTGYSFRAWIASAATLPNIRPVCRFYGTPGVGPNSHFYTIDIGECATVQNDPGWKLEATAVFFAHSPANGGCANGRKAVYRAYNNRFAQNDSNHRYAVEPAPYDQALARGWSAEGVVMCAEP